MLEVGVGDVFLRIFGVVKVGELVIILVVVLKFLVILVILKLVSCGFL